MTTSTVLNFLEDEDYDGPEDSGAERYTDAPSASQAVTEVQESPTESALSPEENATIGAVVDAATPAADSVAAASPKRVRRNPAAPKYGRTHFTEKDALILGFLRKFPLTTSKIVGVLLNIKKASGHKRLLALKELGMVNSEQVLGMAQLWYLTTRGHDILEAYLYLDDRTPRPHRPGVFNLTKIGHRLAVAQVAAQLLAGTSQVTHSGRIPLPKGLDLLPLLVPEPYMNTEFGTSAFGSDLAKSSAEQAWRTQKAVADQVKSGDVHISDALAMAPALWTLVNSVSYRKENREYHPVDLAIDLEAYRTDIKKPVSLGFEIELHPKSRFDLKAIFATMKTQTQQGEFPVCGQFVYVTHDPKIAKSVAEVAKELDMERLMRITPLKDSAGNPYNGQAWTL